MIGRGENTQLLDERQINRLVELYDEGRTSVNEICKMFGISRPSFYNYLKKKRAKDNKINWSKDIELLEQEVACPQQIGQLDFRYM